MINVDKVKFYLSAPEGHAGFAVTGSPGRSWGGWMSTTQLSATPLNDLFTSLTGPENAARQTDYACLFLVNSDPTFTMLNTFVWLPRVSFPGLGATVRVGVDPTGVTAWTSELTQAVTITSSVLVPAGVSFTGVSESLPEAPDYPGAAWVGSVPPWSCVGLWVARTGQDTGPVNADGCGVQVNFDSRGNS